MRRGTTVHTIRTGVLAVLSLLLAATATVPAVATSPPGPATLRPTAVLAPAASLGTAPQRIRLLTGDVVTLPTAARPVPGVLRAPGSTSSFALARTPGHLYVVPSAVRSVLGRLDLSLFDAQALAAGPAETPVSVRYASAGAPTAVAGVEVRSRSGLAGTGVVTAKSSAALAKALRTRSATAVFRGVTSITAASPTVTPAFPMHTVTLRLVGPDGGPADGFVIVLNVDDMRRAATATDTLRGEGRVSVPAGNYQVAAFVYTDSLALPVLPEVAVTGPRTVTLDARTATTVPTVITPQPAEDSGTSLDVTRTDAKGFGTASVGVLGFGDGPIAVSPVDAAAVRHGSISSSLVTVRTEPVPTPSYEYALGYSYANSVPTVMRAAPRPGDLEQVAMRYRGSTATSGSLGVLDNGLMTAASGMSIGFFRRVPARMTVWLGGSPDVRSISSYTAAYDWETDVGSEYLSGAARPVTPGVSRAEEWNRRPSHPSFVTPSDTDPWCGACVQDGLLQLVVPSFSDNDPHHWGLVDDPARVAWRVSSGGTELGAGDGPLVGAFDLPAGRAPVTVTHREAMHRLGFPDSTTSTTWSAPRTALGQTLTGWSCPDGTGPCRALGLLEPRYDLPVSDTGILRAGTVTGRLTLAPYLSNTTVTSLAVDVRYGRGPWHSVPTAVTGPTSFSLRVPVPAGAGVATLRVRASDSARSSVTQTIVGAWTAAS